MCTTVSPFHIQSFACPTGGFSSVPTKVLGFSTCSRSLTLTFGRLHAMAATPAVDNVYLKVLNAYSTSEKAGGAVGARRADLTNSCVDLPSAGRQAQELRHELCGLQAALKRRHHHSLELEACKLACSLLHLQRWPERPHRHKNDWQ